MINRLLSFRTSGSRPQQSPHLDTRFQPARSTARTIAWCTSLDGDFIGHGRQRPAAVSGPGRLRRRECPSPQFGRVAAPRRCYDSFVSIEAALVLKHDARKQAGAFYTPPDALRSLVRWVARSPTDRMLDPSCGDGRFLAAHERSVGVEQDPSAYALACRRAPWALIHEGEFFDWAATTKERFECAAGNPPFIRYQRFSGTTRERALRLCAALGAPFSALTSSWAPFLVATAALLKRGGRMAFVVPSEIGHAPYAVPLLRFLASHFTKVHLVAVRERVFTELSEDILLLFADGFGEQTSELDLTITDRFQYSPDPPAVTRRVGVREWEDWYQRLRPFLLPASVRDLYQDLVRSPSAARLGTLAKVGIGYVTGANDFFHLRPSRAEAAGIAPAFLRPSVRNGRVLTGNSVTASTVRRWLKADEPVLLLKLSSDTPLTPAVKRYLNSPEGRGAQATYKCRHRSPWYVVPDVTVPHAFLTYMSSYGPALVANRARCVGTNSVHTVNLTGDWSLSKLQRAWEDPFTSLSCEIEGHPLGGGVLKVEPGEAVRVALVTKQRWSDEERCLIAEGVDTMRQWRHCRGQEAQAV